MANNNTDEGCADVLFRLEDVQKGPGFADRLRREFEDFVQKLEADSKSYKIHDEKNPEGNVARSSGQPREV